ncbi:MAG TPA: pectin acetylesterase-family hydrolase [Polyangiales bacterium]|nr:pectin acetylesterase-family hydrolase [Polyangiales bacterium]
MRSSPRWALLLAVALLGCSDDDTTSSEMSPVGMQPAAGTSGSGGTSGGAGAGSAGKAGASGTAGSAGKAGATAGSAGKAGATATAGTSAGEADAGAVDDTNSSGGADLAALKAAGIDKYIGVAKPASMQAGENGETTFTFDVASGPRCLRGDPYSMGIRDQKSENLIIYLQGGGSCSSAVCSATQTANPTIPKAGLMSPSDASNPVSSWNLVYVPYCDGSLHYGDKDHADETPPRYHHGLKNLSAALDVGVARFPKPKQILLAGSSAGGLGTIYASSLVRLLYPEAKLFVFNDSGVGVSTPDGVRAKLTRDEWGTQQIIPPSCPECSASAHSTPVITWTLTHDPELRVAIFSAYEDSVLADTFLMIGGPAFKQALLDETGKVVKAYPERAKRFFIEGTKHTTAGNIQATMINGLSIAQWLGYMLNDDPKWTDALQ